MNLQVYGGNVTVGGGGAITWRSGKQTALNTELNAYAVANGAVDVAGFTEVRVGTTNAGVIAAGLADLAASLNMPGGAPHVLMAHCGNSALGVGEFVGIAVRGDATVNSWGRVYDVGNPPIATHQQLALAGGAPHRVAATSAPAGATLDRRCIVYADVTLPAGGTYRIGFIHNLYVLRDNLYVILSRLPVLISRAQVGYVGGDFNAPPRNILSRRAVSRLYALAPPGPTSAGGHTYDWWARNVAPFPGATIHTTLLNLAASDHCGVGIII